jgi:ankyrin repeat protein
MRLLGLMAIAALAAAVPSAAAAQTMSEGFNFLKAVKDRDGTKVTEALDRPGSTVVNARDIASGESALHVVTARRDATWLRFLIGKGANANIADRRGVTPLQLATNLGWADGVEILVKAGASVDHTNDAGETPLISAVHRRDAALVRALLKAGADPERNDNSGRSARDYAQLMGPQSTILAELDKARDETAKAAKTYGPGV